jgi:hypothetical protein
MNSRTLLIVIVLGALAVAGAIFVLSSGEPGGEAGPGARGEKAAPDALPTFASDVAGREPTREQVAKPVEVPHAAPGQQGEGAAAHAAMDFGPMRTLSGTITRASDGTPLGGVVLSGFQAASLTMTATAGASFPTATSSDDGAFRYAVPVSASKLTLTLPANGATQDFPLEPDGKDLEVDLVFDSGFRIDGRVTDGNLSPVADAQVECGGAQATTTADGHFQLRDVWPEGEPAVKVTASATLRTRAVADVLVPRSSRDIPTVELKLLGAGALTGVVSFSDRSPAPGAMVEVVLRQLADGVGETQELSAECNEEGLYTVDHVPAGHYLVQVTDRSKQPLAVEVHSRGERRRVEWTKPVVATGSQELPLGTWMQDVPVVEGQTTRADFQLSAGATLAGRVLDELRRPVVGARVALQRHTTWPAPEMNGSSIMSTEGMMVESRGEGDGAGKTTVTRDLGELRTDAEGKYAFSGLSAGEHRLAVNDLAGHLSPALREFVLRGDEHLDSEDFTLIAGLSVRTRIVDPEGRGLAGASISIAELGSNVIGRKDFAGTSGADGWFEKHGLTPGKKRISISLSGYGFLWEELDPAAPPPSYVLKPAPKLHGLVVDASSNEPVLAYALKLEMQGSTMISDVQSREGGAFEEDVGEDKSCTVTITAPGYLPLTLENIVPSSTAVRPVLMRLVRDG